VKVELPSAGPPSGIMSVGDVMETEASLTIADLDVELSAIGGYDSISGMPCGCLHGPIRPYLRPSAAGDVPNLAPISE
jgi:hypothetical protein